MHKKAASPEIRNRGQEKQGKVCACVNPYRKGLNQSGKNEDNL